MIFKKNYFWVSRVNFKEVMRILNFLRHLVKISDAFKLDILREKLIPYKTRFFEAYF